MKRDPSGGDRKGTPVGAVAGAEKGTGSTGEPSTGSLGLRTLVLTLFFLSGACGLVYEVVWMRMLTLVFGATAFATSTILASFFTGLALGGIYFGRLVDRGRRPLLVYALLEGGIGLFAFLMPMLLAAVTALYVGVARHFEVGFYGISLIRFALSFLVLLAPATLMGGTLPVIVKFFAREGRRLGWHVGRLYAVNTFGAVAGTLSAGFFLILILGVREAAYLAGLVNLVIAGTAFALHRRLLRRVPGEGDAGETEEAPAVAPESPFSPGVARLALLAIGLSGFCALAYEVFWTRALVFFLDNSTHAFTTILTSFLLGIALGGIAIAGFVDRGKRLLGWLGAIEVLIGASAILAMPILNHSIPVFERMAGTEVNSLLPWKWMGVRFFNSLSVTLVPTVLMGMAFPVAGKIWTRSAGTVGRALGEVYGVNTLGGVLGSLLAGFALIPVVGVQNGILLVAGINVLVGGALILSEPTMARQTRIGVVLGLGVAVTSVGILHVQAGTMTLTSHYERQEIAEVLSYEEGIGGTVKVYRDIYGDRILSVDGFPVAGTPLDYHDIQKALAHFPMLLSHVPSPRVAVIGFGAGGTSWGMMQHPVTKVDCVELVPAVPRAAQWFRDVNHGVLQMAGFNLILGDGRNYVLVADEEYDVISIDATSPKMAGNGSLYALEFYRLLRERLTDEGVVIQWVPFHLLSDGEVRMTVKTFLSVFPHSSIWFTPLRAHLGLIGTMGPLIIDFAALKEKFEIPGVREDLEYVNVADPVDFLTAFVMSEETLTEYVGGARENTDNHPYLEFTPAMAYFVGERYRIRNLLNFRETRESVLPWLVNMGDTPEQRAEVAERIQKRFEAIHYSINGDILLSLGQREAAIAEYEEALRIDPEEKNWLNAIWRYGNPRR